MHVPVATNVTVLALTVQRAVVREPKLTGRPDEAVAVTPNEGVPRERLASEPKVMVWPAWVTLKLWATVAAGA